VPIQSNCACDRHAASCPTCLLSHEPRSQCTYVRLLRFLTRLSVRAVQIDCSQRHLFIVSRTISVFAASNVSNTISLSPSISSFKDLTRKLVGGSPRAKLPPPRQTGNLFFQVSAGLRSPDCFYEIAFARSVWPGDHCQSRCWVQLHAGFLDAFEAYPGISTRFVPRVYGAAHPSSATLIPCELPSISTRLSTEEELCMLRTALCVCICGLNSKVSRVKHLCFV
jgi:hypothetical protein